MGLVTRIRTLQQKRSHSTMTYTEDFIAAEEGQALDAAAPTYPAFGTFTPVVNGVLIGVLGLAGSIYLILNQVMPAWQKFQERKQTGRRNSL